MRQRPRAPTHLDSWKAKVSKPGRVAVPMERRLALLQRAALLHTTPKSSREQIDLLVSLNPHRGGRAILPRKEVIQPQLPLRLPCYDFIPVAGPTFGACPLTVGATTSGVTHSRDVTGGVYKARERIQRSMADLRLLATPASCRRISACNLNWGRF